MKKIRKKGRHKGQFNNRLVAVTVTICLLCCTVSAGLLAQPVVVYASIGTSIKSLIITLIAAIGIGNSNPNFTNALDQSQLLNSSYESLVDESISAEALDQELSNLGVDVTNMTNVLGNSAEDAAAVSAQDSTGALGEIGAATAGQNIKAAAEHLAETGEVGAAIGGKAAGCLNGMGSLLPVIWNQQIHSEGVQKLQKLISQSLPYDTNDSVIQQMYAGGQTGKCFYSTGANQYKIYYVPSGWYCVRVGNFNYVVNGTDVAGQYKYYDASQYSYSTLSLNAHSKNLVQGTYGYLDSEFVEVSDSMMTQLMNGTATITNRSPDLIGTNGNQSGNWTINNNINNFNFPDIKPIVNITNNSPTEYITPIDYDDYKNWQSTANQNTQNKDYGEQQGEDFQNLIRDFINQWNGQIPQPTVAPINPVNPIVTPVPTIPVTPTPSPEEGAEIPKGFTTPELKDKFPFCIPYDIFLAFGLLTAQGEAPVFDWDITFGQYGTYNVHIDLSPWDPAARLLRILQLLLFIVCLAVGTRKLGGFGSGEE